MPSPAAHVLHVEDDEEWSGLVDIWLNRRGFKVLRLRSCAEMRRYLQGCPQLPSCLLLDLQLPDGDGRALCDEIKKSPSFQHLPIIILTGQAVSSSECLSHQALYRVAKDVGAEEELSAALESILRQQERAQGVLDIDDLRIDSRTRLVQQHGRTPIALDPGAFMALRLLMRSSPKPVELAALYGAFLQRHTYDKEDAALAVRNTVRNYVCRLRDNLGPLGARIESVRLEGYVYKTPPNLRLRDTKIYLK